MDRSTREEAVALLAIKSLAGVGDRGVDRLVRRFGSGVEALAAPRARLGEVLGRNRGLDAVDRAAAEKIVLSAVSRGVGVHPRGSVHYPDALLQLADPPPVLFTLGEVSLLLAPRSVAVIGSRRASTYGYRMAYRLAARWAGEGHVVVSGMALGVDGAAHEGALAAGGNTVAVLGSGVDRPTPRTHLPLARRVRERGLLVSEFPPGTRPRPHHFPQRNRVMAALAHAVVVVEGARGSGALITVEHALDLGREVFALPGPVDRLQSEAANALIRDGAHAVLDPDDLNRVMGWEPAGRRGEGGGQGGRVGSDRVGRATGGGPGPRGPVRGDALSGPLRRALAGGVHGADDLAIQLGRPLRDVLVDLARLEVAGLVRRDEAGRYVLAGYPS
jgi:DNA processing protein